MKEKLSDIAKIETGYTFRKEPSADGGQVRPITLKHLSSDYCSIIQKPDPIRYSGIPERKFLQKDDILFTAKGRKNRAFAFDGNINNAIASSPFFVLRIKDSNQYCPGYLAWYLNQSPAISYYEREKTGTSTRNISKKALSQLKIPFPSLEKQQLISHLYSLQRKEKILTENILQKREQLIQTKLLKTVKQ